MTSSCCHHGCDDGIVVTIIDGKMYARNCDCTLQLIARNRLKKAFIPVEFAGVKVSDFDANLYTGDNANIAKSAKNTAIKYVEKFSAVKSLGKGLYFYSTEKGSGKTMLAIAVGNALMSRYQAQVRFLTTVDLLQEIKNSFNTGGASGLLEAIKDVEVLILDDIGTENITSWASETLFAILDKRMTSKKITIFTSNSHPHDLKHDTRITSRVSKMAMAVALPNESIRQVIANQEEADLMQLLLG